MEAEIYETAEGDSETNPPILKILNQHRWRIMGRVTNMAHATPEENAETIARAERLRDLGYDIMFGPTRPYSSEQLSIMGRKPESAPELEPAAE